MVLLAIAGIGLEIAGFLLIIKSTKRLDLEEGGFMADRYVDPKTKQPPPHIESFPNPLMYRPGIYAVMVGLGLQGLDIFINDVLNFEL
jgi:hypothetical protein